MDQELKAELARLDRELNIAQASQPVKDDAVTAWEQTPLPANHWSLQESWIKSKNDAGLSEPATETSEAEWKKYAAALSGLIAAEDNQ